MSEASLSRSRERMRSAGGRLQTPISSAREADSSDPEISPVRKPLRRVKSALETKREHESSTEIFPQVADGARAKKDPSWGRTRYREDFGPKAPLTQVRQRPCSPTRMNNPHPAESFLVWRQPVRTHKHSKAVQPHADGWKFINEGFYDDYTNEYNTGDAQNEVPITNVAKIPFPGSRRNGHTSTPHLSCMGVSGTKAQLHSNPKHTTSCGRGSGHQQAGMRPASSKSRMIHHTLKGSTMPIFKEWVATASPIERDVVIEMLKAAHDDSEEIRLQKVVADVLQADSAERVQGWLMNATPQERQIVLNVMETLAIAAGDHDPHLIVPSALLPTDHRHHRNHRHTHTYPVTLRHHSTSSRQHSHSSSHSSTGGQYSRHFHPSRPPSRLSARKGRLVSSSADGAGKIGRQDMGNVVMAPLIKKMTLKEDSPRTRGIAPELWHHRIKPKALGTSLINRDSVYNVPHKDRGQHFALHPEWPIA